MAAVVEQGAVQVGLLDQQEFLLPKVPEAAQAQVTAEASNLAASQAKALPVLAQLLEVEAQAACPAAKVRHRRVEIKLPAAARCNWAARLEQYHLETGSQPAQPAADHR